MQLKIHKQLYKQTGNKTLQNKMDTGTKRAQYK